jgi:hypothetical protein
MTPKVLSLAIAMATAVAFVSNSFAQQTDGRDVFDSYASFAVGGSWTTTVGDDKLEATYTWVRGKKFAQLDAKGGVLPFVAMFGVDPDTKKCTWWFYNEDGSLGRNVMTRESDGVWMLQGSTKGGKGETRHKGRISRVDDNTVEHEVIESIVNGEEQSTGKFTWKRQR